MSEGQADSDVVRAAALIDRERWAGDLRLMIARAQALHDRCRSDSFNGALFHEIREEFASLLAEAIRRGDLRDFKNEIKRFDELREWHEPLLAASVLIEAMASAFVRSDSQHLQGEDWLVYQRPDGGLPALPPEPELQRIIWTGTRLLTTASTESRPVENQHRSLNFVTLADAAELFKRHKGTISKLVKNNPKIRSDRKGKQKRVCVEDLHAHFAGEPARDPSPSQIQNQLGRSRATLRDERTAGS